MDDFALIFLSAFQLGRVEELRPHVKILKDQADLILKRASERSTKKGKHFPTQWINALIGINIILKHLGEHAHNSGHCAMAH